MRKLPGRAKAARILHDPDLGMIRLCSNREIIFFWRCSAARVGYLSTGGTLEHAQQMVAHESPGTTKLHDRTKERLTQDEVTPIRWQP